MPNVDGFEVLKKIKDKSKPNNTKVIVVSGFLNGKSVKEITKLGADAYFDKPVNTAELIAEIEKLLGRQIAILSG